MTYNCRKFAIFEALVHPADYLFELLRTASGLHGRRRRMLPVSERIHRIAELTEDFSGLRGLPAFQCMEIDLEKNHSSLRKIIQAQNWHQMGLA